MADNHPTGPAETGAEMDYAEHERTYAMFLSMSKWLVIVCVALLISMAFGFFAGVAQSVTVHDHIKVWRTF